MSKGSLILPFVQVSPISDISSVCKPCSAFKCRAFVPDCDHFINLSDPWLQNGFLLFSYKRITLSSGKVKVKCENSNQNRKDRPDPLIL